MQPLSRQMTHLVLWGICLLSVLLSLWLVTPDRVLDDAFISLRYAKNWAAGHGPVYNPGEAAVEGYTNFLWVALGAAAIASGLEPLTFWRLLSLLAQVGTIWAVFRLGRCTRSGESGIGRSLLAPLLLAVHVSFVAYPMLGMETSFFAFVMTSAVLLVARDAHRTHAGAVRLGVVLLVVALTRFDGLGLAGLLLGWVVLVERRFRAAARAALPLGLGLVVFNLWRWRFYDELLPNTFYAKTGDLGDQLGAGLVYLARFAVKGGPYVLLLLIPLIAVLRMRRLPKPWRLSRPSGLATWMVTGYLAYVVFVGGDWMPYYRFVLPVLPLVCFLFQEAFWGGLDRLEVSLEGPMRRRLLRSGALALVLVWGAVPLAASRYVRPTPPGPYWSAADARAIGQALDERLPPETLVAVEWAGIIPYYMDRPVLDIFGLNDAEIARSDFPGSSMGRAITPDYLVERRPDLVVYSARLFDSLQAAAASGPEVRGKGLPISRFFLSLLEPEHGYRRCVVELEGGRYWPTLIRSDWEGRRNLCLAVD